jgi:hypothetical protein
MAADSGLLLFQFATDDLGAATTNTTTFYAPTNFHVVEVGIFVSVDYVPGGASQLICSFFRTTASLGLISATEGTAPGKLATASETLTMTANVTVRDGKVIKKRTSFTVYAGELLTVDMDGGATSGTGFPYILGYWAGEELGDGMLGPVLAA